METTALAVTNGETQLTVNRTIALEPQNISEAMQLCKLLVASGMLPKAITKPEQAMVIIMKGRELGLSTMQSFACINVIEGKAATTAEYIVARVKQSAACEYFRFVKGDEKSATFETRRRGEPDTTSLTFTMEQAQSMGLAGRDNWKKQPANMLRWRAATALARLVYPEATLGLYSPDEAQDIVSRQSDAPIAVEPQENLGDKIADYALDIAACRTVAELKQVAARLGKEPAAVRDQVRPAYVAREAEIKKPVPAAEEVAQ